MTWPTTERMSTYKGRLPTLARVMEKRMSVSCVGRSSCTGRSGGASVHSEPTVTATSAKKVSRAASE